MKYGKRLNHDTKQTPKLVPFPPRLILYDRQVLYTRQRKGSFYT